MNPDNPHMPRMRNTVKQFKPLSVIATPSLGARAARPCLRCWDHSLDFREEVSPRRTWAAALNQRKDGQLSNKAGVLLFPEDLKHPFS